MKERPILFSAPMVRAILDGTKTQTRRIVKPQPPSVEDVRAKAGDGYHLSDLGAPGMWRVMGPVWAARELMAGNPVDAKARADVGPQWRCPYGARGDRLWVREAFTHITGNGVRVHYRADGEPTDREGRVLPTEPGLRRWFPSIHMPRKISRITLDVTGVRVERVQSISKDDAIAEGARRFDNIPGSKLFPDSPHQNRWSMEQPEDCGHCLGSPQMAFANLWIKINGAESWDANPWVWVVEFNRVASKAALSHLHATTEGT